MGAALLWDSLLCPHAIMHLNHQLMHSKRREQSCVQHQRFSAHWGLGLCASRNRSALSCPDSRGSAHPSTPTYSSLRHHSRGSGSTASAGRGLTGVSTCKLFTLLEGEQASRSLGMQSAQRDFDVTEPSPLRTWHPMEVGGTKLQLEPGLWSLSCSTAEKNILARFRFPPNSTKSFQQELLFVWLVCFFVFNDFIILHILPEGCCLRVF